MRLARRSSVLGVVLALVSASPVVAGDESRGDATLEVGVSDHETPPPPPPPVDDEPPPCRWQRTAANEAVADIYNTLELVSTIVETIVNAQSARGVVAIVWKAGLGMRLAMKVQMQIAKIAPAAAIKARDGLEYPLSEDELTWQLEFFGAA